MARNAFSMAARDLNAARAAYQMQDEEAVRTWPSIALHKPRYVNQMITLFSSSKKSDFLEFFNEQHPDFD